MCGIAGVTGPALRAFGSRVLDPMREAILFRGRDQQGEWTDGEAAFLCQARLAIVDVEHGQQPMRTDDGRYTLVFAGEIYNHVELRRELEAEGAVFHTHADTEVVLQGYRLRGPGLCRDLNGMFAIAIWDAVEGELFLARDRLGKKPLYWWHAGETLAFASTLDAFPSLPGWRGEVSAANVSIYTALGAFPGERSVYTDAYSVAPATWLSVRPGERPYRVERYWWPDFSAKSREPLDRLEQRYEELLVDATRIRLRSDVPVALTFSGGVDSGSIAWACAKRLDTQLECFTIDYDTPEEPSGERAVAEAAAAHLGLPWRHIQFDYRRHLLDELDEAYSYYDEPCSQLALVYAHRLYHEVKPFATVALSGNGADELFTGYRGDEQMRQRDVIAAIGRPFRPLLRLSSRVPALLRLPPADALAQTLTVLADARTDAAVRDELETAAAALAADVRAANVTTWLDLKMLMSMLWTNRDGNFRLADTSGLAGQVEVRSPYFDHRMIEFAARLPHRYKVGSLRSPDRNKFLPRRFYARHVPPEVATAPKRGMAANLRWDVALTEEPAFEERFAEAYDIVEAAGLDDTGSGRAAWRAYNEALRSGGDVGAHGGRMMAGFMLGMWLRRSRTRAAVAA